MKVPGSEGQRGLIADDRGELSLPAVRPLVKKVKSQVGRLRRNRRRRYLHKQGQKFGHSARVYTLKANETFPWVNSYCPANTKKKWHDWIKPWKSMDTLIHTCTFQPLQVERLRTDPNEAMKDRDPDSVLQHLSNLGVENVQPCMVKFKTEGGRSANIKLIYIRSPVENKKREAFVYCPGRSGGIGYLSDVALIQAYKKGHDVCLLSYRGYDSNMMSREPSQESMADDLDVAINFLIGEKGFKPEQLNFTACSLGCDVLVNGLARRVERLDQHGREEKWGDIQLRAPFKDLETMARQRIKDYIPVFGRILHYPMYGALSRKPLSQHRNLELIAPYIRSAQFIVAKRARGVTDTIIEPWQTWANYEYLKELCKPYDTPVNIWELEGMDHRQICTTLR